MTRRRFFEGLKRGLLEAIEIEQGDKTMNFFEAMQAAYEGRAVRRRAWRHAVTNVVIAGNHVPQIVPERAINAIRLSVQVGNSKERPTFPGMLIDGDYKGQIAQFNTEDVSSQDWELVEQPRKRGKASEEEKLS